MSATYTPQGANAVSLADEEAVKKILVDSVLGLWDVVNNLTRVRPSRQDRYRVTIFGSARAKPGTVAYEETKRVAKALVDIREKFNASGQNKPIEISRDDIAHYVGTATESLIRTLSDFKAEKLIEIKEGKILIANLDKLKNLLY